MAALIFSLNVSAQDISSSQIDAAARSAKSGSIMFTRSQDLQDYERQRYEEEMRARQQYEAEMQAREEAYKKAQEERLKALQPVNLFGNTLKIYATVNGEVLTTRDMQKQADLFVATTQIPITAQNKKMVLERVFQGAVDEKLKMQEAKKNNISIPSKELKAGIENFAKMNGLTVDQLQGMLDQTHVDSIVFAEQIKTEMAWARLVQMKAAQTIRVSKADIKNAIAQITRDKNKQKFMVSEIVIAKKDGKHIEVLVQNLREDPRFELYAMQFSQSPTAKNGGNLGWVSAEQLPDKLLSKLKNMKEGEISDAIVLGTDYYILKLQKKYTPGVDKMPVPSEAQILRMLENKKMEEVANKYLRDLRNKAVIERKA
jgi:parvulin-like peptidyl-prolyl isomerase